MPVNFQKVIILPNPNLGVSAKSVKVELRSLEGMHLVEKLLLGVVIIIGLLGLIYIYMIAQVATTSAQIGMETYSDLAMALILQGVMINAIFLWRIVEELTEIKISLMSKKKR